MNAVILLVCMSEYSEWTVVQWVQVFRISDARNLVVFPLEKTSLHGGVEPWEHFVLGNTVDVRGVGVGAGMARMRRTAHVIVPIFRHLVNYIFCCKVIY